MMRVIVLLAFAAVLGCGKKEPTGGGQTPPPGPAPVAAPRGVPKWEEVSATAFGFKALFPKGEVIEMDELPIEIDKKALVSGRTVSGHEYDIDQLKAGKFVARYRFRVFAYKPRPKAANELVDAAVEERTAALLDLKGRTGSAPRAFTWLGRPATEVVYEATADRPKITVRRLTTEAFVYVVSTTEALVQLPNDVTKFFDSFSLLPVAK